MKFISQLPRRLWLLLGIPVGLALYLLALFVPDFAEWYARYPYHWLSLAVNRVTGLLPFSLAEILLVLLIAVVLFWLIFGIVRLIRKRENRKKRLVRFLLTPLCALSVVWFLFVVTCGINYSRYTFSQVSGLPIRDSSVEELYELNVSLAQEVSRLRQELPENQWGVMESGFSSSSEL